MRFARTIRIYAAECGQLEIIAQTNNSLYMSHTHPKKLIEAFTVCHISITVPVIVILI